MDRAPNSPSPGDKRRVGRVLRGRPSSCADRSLPGGASGGRAALGGGSAGRRRRGASRGLLQEVSTEAPGRGGAERGGVPCAPLHSAPSARPQVAAHEEGPLSAPRALRPPGAAPLAPAGPAAAGEAWRPGPDASRSVALPLRLPPTTETFLRPAEPKTNRVRRVPRPARLRASPRPSAARPRGRHGAHHGSAPSLTFSAAAAIVTGNLPGVAAAALPGRGGGRGRAGGGGGRSRLGGA